MKVGDVLIYDEDKLLVVDNGSFDCYERYCLVSLVTGKLVSFITNYEVLLAMYKPRGNPKVTRIEEILV